MLVFDDPSGSVWIHSWRWFSLYDLDDLLVFDSDIDTQGDEDGQQEERARKQIQQHFGGWMEEVWFVSWILMRALAVGRECGGNKQCSASTINSRVVPDNRKGFGNFPLSNQSSTEVPVLPLREPQ